MQASPEERAPPEARYFIVWTLCCFGKASEPIGNLLDRSSGVDGFSESPGNWRNRSRSLEQRVLDLVEQTPGREQKASAGRRRTDEPTAFAAWLDRLALFGGVDAIAPFRRPLARHAQKMRAFFGIISCRRRSKLRSSLRFPRPMWRD